MHVNDPQILFSKDNVLIKRGFILVKYVIRFKIIKYYYYFMYYNTVDVIFPKTVLSIIKLLNKKNLTYKFS